MDKSDSLLQSSSKGLRSSIFFQGSSRILTFFLNQLTIRLTSPSAYAFSSIHFEILQSTILFLSRESVRLAMQRIPSENAIITSTSTESNKSKKLSDQLQLIKNTSLISVYIGIVISLLVSLFYFYSLPNFPYSKTCIFIYTVSSFIELLSEPYYEVLQWRQKFSKTASAEGLGTIICSLLSFAISVLGRNKAPSSLPFALGNLSEKVTIFFTLRYFAKQPFSIFLHKVGENERYIFWDSSTLRIICSHTYQVLLKHLITKGDKIMVAWYASPSAQGPYALASNYGSLLARIVFRPVEDHSHIVFAQLTHYKNKKDEKKALNLLAWILKLYSYMSLFILFGSNYSDIVLLFGAGSKWASPDSSSILSWYAMYIPFMAANGVLEAFYVSAANSSQLYDQGKCYLASAVFYFITGKVLLSWFNLGSHGLILANILNLSLRICFALRFILHNYKDFSLPRSLPRPFLLALSILLSIISSFLVKHWRESKVPFLVYFLSAPLLAILYSCFIILVDKDVRGYAKILLSKYHIK
ncbi:Oligosaccharide translocation protein rft1 [Schizosaccharomyces pombe]